MAQGKNKQGEEEEQAMDEDEDEDEEEDEEAEQAQEQADLEAVEVKVVNFKIYPSRQVLQFELAFDKKLQGTPPPLQIPLKTIRSEVSIDAHVVMLHRVGDAPALRLRFVISGDAASRQVCKFKQELHNYFRGEEIEGVTEAVKSLLYIWEDVGQVQIRWTGNYTTIQPLLDVNGTA